MKPTPIMMASARWAITRQSAGFPGSVI